MPHFLSLADLSGEQLSAIVDETIASAAGDLPSDRSRLLAGKAIALVFEKPSTRTRVAFEVAAVELGGHAVFLDATSSQLGRGEPIKDTARVLASYCAAIVHRTQGQEKVDAMASASNVPVINALTDLLHPTQLVADLATVVQNFGSLDGLRCAYVGDGNNMAHSWLHAAGLLGFELSLACPTDYSPEPTIVEWAKERGATISLTTDPQVAVGGAHVVSTDVWASMGQEAEQAKREQAFRGYCLDRELMKAAAANAIVLHCLPAHRGEEITDEVLEGDSSRAWQQAANRLHANKAILSWCLADPDGNTLE